MRFISTRVHGYLDYIVSALLIASPWMLGFAGGGIETWLPVLLGGSAILYSLLTDYELGVVRTFAMPAHLTLDFLSGALLATAPWLFGFAHEVYLPHLVFGVFEMGASLMTMKVPENKREQRHRTSMA